jgi:hypothetical protein
MLRGMHILFIGAIDIMAPGGAENAKLLNAASPINDDDWFISGTFGFADPAYELRMMSNNSLYT